MTKCVQIVQLGIPQIPHNSFGPSAQIRQLFAIFLKKKSLHMFIVHGPVGQATTILKAIPPTIQKEPIDQNSMLQQCSLGTRSDKNRQCTKLHFDQI